MSAVEEVERFKRAEEAKAEGTKKKQKQKKKAEPANKKASASRPKVCSDRKKSTGKKAVVPKPVARKRGVVCSPSTEKKAGVKGAAIATPRIENAGESNKENVPPFEVSPPGDEKFVASTPSVALKGKGNRVASALRGQDNIGAVTPGFVLTPAVDSASPPKATRYGRGQNSGVSGAKKTKKVHLSVEKQHGKATKSRRVTFGGTQKAEVASLGRAPPAMLAVPATPATPATATAENKTSRVVNFPQSLTIDLDKYGYGIGVRRPPGCPPLFRTVEDHGRQTVPTPAPFLPLLEASQNVQGQKARACTPFRGKPDVPFSREALLAKMIHSGLRNDSRTPPVLSKSVYPFELSPHLADAFARLQQQL